MEHLRESKKAIRHLYVASRELRAIGGVYNLDSLVAYLKSLIEEGIEQIELRDISILIASYKRETQEQANTRHNLDIDKKIFQLAAEQEESKSILQHTHDEIEELKAKKIG